MLDDEKLSDGAQIYTKYYGDKWEEANKRYQSAIAIGDISGAEAAKLEMQELHALAEDIRSLDAEGKVSGVYYDIPLFNQGRYNLCWAYCQVMIENFMAGNSMSQEQADARAQTIAEYVNGTGTNPDGSFVWNTGGWPTNSKDIKNQMVTFPQVNSFSKLEKVLESNPAYAYYYNSLPNGKNVAHLVVVTGVASAPGHDELVTTNNPWGEKNIQTYDDFKAGIPGDIYKMKLIDILRI